MRRSSILFHIIVITIVVTFTVNVQFLKAAAKNPEPIKILLLDWTSQIVLSEITGQIFQSVGYNVEYVKSGSDGQWWLLKFGKADIQVEVWEGTMAQKLENLVSENNIIDAGNHDVTTREEWWYPLYVEKLCPGLPDWRALNRCYSIFATDETSPKGRYLTGPWEKYDWQRIQALKLNFEIVRVEDSDSMIRELERAVSLKQPIVLFNWTPNWVEAKYEGRFVEFPEYEPDCEKDRRWGLNQDYLWDCGNPKDGWLKKVVVSGFPEKYPCAYEIMKKISFTNKIIAEVSALVDNENMDEKSAASLWIKQNKKMWEMWIPKHCFN